LYITNTNGMLAPFRTASLKSYFAMYYVCCVQLYVSSWPQSCYC